MTVVEELLNRLKSEYGFVERNPNLSEDRKVENIIAATCIGCAAVAATPLPFADFLVLTPAQGLMGWRIARVRGMDMSRHEALEVVKEILGVIGMGLLARQMVISATRMVPVFGSIASVPMVFGTTFAIGQAMDYYVREKLAGRSVPEDALRGICREARGRGEALGKRWSKKTGHDGDSVADSFLRAKDEFVAEARQAFETTYAEFKKSLADLVPEPKATPVKPKPAPAKEPAKKPTKKPAQKKPAMVKKPAAKKPAPKKPATATGKKPVTKSVSKKPATRKQKSSR